jgi:hypothetical protein
MRRIAVVTLTLLAQACAQPSSTLTYDTPTNERALREYQAANPTPPSLRADPRPVPETPEQRSQRERGAARNARENSLLEDALASRPDYVQALRRAAVANIDAEPVAGRRELPAARERRIAAEEARLSDLIEKRRRERQQAGKVQDRNRRAEAAAGQCLQLGAQIEASYYNPRSILNLEASAAGAQARNQCIQDLNRRLADPNF